MYTAHVGLCFGMTGLQHCRCFTAQCLVMPLWHCFWQLYCQLRVEVFLAPQTHIVAMHTAVPSVEVLLKHVPLRDTVACCCCGDVVVITKTCGTAAVHGFLDSHGGHCCCPEHQL